MIQKMQKTVEILQDQFIDKTAEISEIVQSKDKCQRSRRYGNSREFTDRIVDVLSRAEEAVPANKCSTSLIKSQRQVPRIQGCRKIRPSVHNQVRRQVQRQDSRGAVVNGSR